jgi:hypothetical protein
MDSSEIVHQNVPLNWVRHGKRMGHIGVRLWQMWHYSLGKKMNNLVPVWKINNLLKSYLLFDTYFTCIFLSFVCLSVWGGPESLGIFVSSP